MKNLEQQQNKIKLEIIIFGNLFNIEFDETIEKTFIDHFMNYIHVDLDEKNGPFFNKKLYIVRKDSVINIPKKYLYRKKILSFYSPDNCEYVYKYKTLTHFFIEGKNYYIKILKKKIIINFLKYDELNHVYLIRILRELLISINKDFYFVHSAALNYKGTGVIISGDKHSGKTTLLTKLLTFKESEFLTNDLIFFNEKGIAFGFPLSIKIGFETIKNNSKILNYISSENLLRKQNFNYYSDLPSLQSKIDFTPSELKKIFNCRLICKSDIKLVFFPKINSKLVNNYVDVKELSDHEGNKLFFKNIITYKDSDWPNRWILKDFKCAKYKKNTKVKFYKIEYSGNIEPSILANEIDKIIC